MGKLVQDKTNNYASIFCKDISDSRRTVLKAGQSSVIFLFGKGTNENFFFA